MFLRVSLVERLRGKVSLLETDHDIFIQWSLSSRNKMGMGSYVSLIEKLSSSQE